MAENHDKYLQTSNTPFMKGQLQRDMGYDGLTSAGEEILNGTYIPPPETGRYTKEFIQQLKKAHPTGAEHPTAMISTEQFKDRWKKLRKKHRLEYQEPTLGT